MVVSQESDDASLALKVTVLPFHAFEQPEGTLLSFTSRKLLPSRVARLCEAGNAPGLVLRGEPRSDGWAWEKAGGGRVRGAAEALEVVARRYRSPKPSPPRRIVHLAVSSRGNLRAATAVGKVPRGRRSRWRG